MDQKEIGRGEEGDVGREIETYGERGIEFMPCLGLDVDGCRRMVACLYSEKEGKEDDDEESLAFSKLL